MRDVYASQQTHEIQMYYHNQTQTKVWLAFF